MMNKYHAFKLYVVHTTFFHNININTIFEGKQLKSANNFCTQRHTQIFIAHIFFGKYKLTYSPIFPITNMGGNPVPMASRTIGALTQRTAKDILTQCERLE